MLGTNSDRSVGSLSASRTVTASSFVGNGSGLTNLPSDPTKADAQTVSNLTPKFMYFTIPTRLGFRNPSMYKSVGTNLAWSATLSQVKFDVVTTNPAMALLTTTNSFTFINDTNTPYVQNGRRVWIATTNDAVDALWVYHNGTNWVLRNMDMDFSVKNLTVPGEAQEGDLWPPRTGWLTMSNTPANLTLSYRDGFDLEAKWYCIFNYSEGWAEYPRALIRTSVPTTATNTVAAWKCLPSSVFHATTNSTVFGILDDGAGVYRRRGNTLNFIGFYGVTLMLLDPTYTY